MVPSLALIWKGKTLTFWMPLLFDSTSVQVVITPLNLLGEQNVMDLKKAGISAISIHTDTATAHNFQRTLSIELISPEQVMKDGEGFERLLKNPLFVSHLMGVVIDKAHCVSSWGEFRPEYKELGRLRFILPLDIPFLVMSATLSSSMLQDVTRLLHLQSGDKLVTIRQSIDQPNINIGVKPIQGTYQSFADLTFLIPDQWKLGDPPPPKFLIFFDNINNAIKAVKFLQARLPQECQDKVKWFNADMTMHFKQDEVKNFTEGNTWGFCMTESFGMWQATWCSLSTLWQCFGHAVRNMLLEGTAILFAEKEYFDVYKAEKERWRVERAKRKATSSKKQRIGKNSPVAAVNIPTGEERSDGSDGSDGSDNEIEISSTHVQQTHAGDTMDTWQLRVKMEVPRETNISQPRRKTSQQTRLEPAMDYFINTDMCPGIGCHSYFVPFISTIPKQQKGPSRSQLAKFYMALLDSKLTDALDDWWEEATIKLYGHAHLHDLGPRLIMPNSILDRIVECTHFFKIKSTADLAKETHWSGANKHGDEIITLIHQVHPLPTPLTSAPLQPCTISSNTNAMLVGRRAIMDALPHLLLYHRLLYLFPSILSQIARAPCQEDPGLNFNQRQLENDPRDTTV
ncbi:uncharacterized protein F5891DRAFT_976372 [Suillus fuscotomentosus]|uniref:DNA 3'-5' helicase n=1 Tax=Suillus fuscotomentosus TaxID=1912939 RepID=A0AAD4HR20_9AGAM|nr:uncharacterized protein F5891DRAFT_976372 [Suillus fuscotomentosus]KAG1905441.1 hypothetical protein F5891DRAFT_976372 [Suillus fuscotomentosus]